MRVKIEAETTLATEIELARDGQKVEAILKLDGGEWVLCAIRPIKAGVDWYWIANRRTAYPEAIKRAITKMAEHADWPTGTTL